MGRSEDTRLALLRAAERMFAERGVETVSLREINAAANQKNHSAAQYHFGSREALIDAVLERHSLPLQERWTAMLDLLEDDERVQGALPLRRVVDVLVRPIASKLEDQDGGIHYLILCSQLVGSPQMPLISRPVAVTPVSLRLSTLMLRSCNTEEALLPLRIQRLLAVMYHALADYGRLQELNAPPCPRDLFIADLVDCVTALVDASPSESTRALLRRPPGGDQADIGLTSG
jgi:AcrR family transcriptional regulator